MPDKFLPTLIQTRDLISNKTSSLGGGRDTHAKPINTFNNTRQDSSSNPLHSATYRYQDHEDNGNLSVWRYRTAAALHEVANLVAPPPLTGFVAMPVCSYRGVAYETPARVNKTSVLQYERKVYLDRVSDAETELRMVYRGVRH